MCIITYSFCNARTYFDILVIFFYSAWKTSFMDWQFSSRKTLKITRNSKDLLLRILWNTFLSNLIKIALIDSVRTTRFCVSYTKIGFTMFWSALSLNSADLIQIGIGLALWISVSLGSYLKREIPAWNLASGMQNSLPTPGTATTVNPSSDCRF